MRTSVLAAACFCMSSAFANTVLWYRFEEHEPGYVMKSSDRVTNEVNAVTMAGRPVSNLANYWPSYAATSQGLEGIYDPVTGKVYPNNAAMSLSQTVNSDEGLSLGPHIETPDCEALHLQSFTIEMFAERNGNYRANECLVRKLADIGADTRCNYYLYRAGIGSNYHYARVCVTDETGAFESGHWKASTTSDNEADKLAGQLLTKKGFWDHIALTYDAATRTATLYSNYTMVKSFTFAEGFSQQVYIDKPLQIGGCGQSLNGGVQGTNFGGLIDEVRISDTALQPSQFLRLCSPAALPETTHLYTFDSATNFSWNSTSPWRNLAPVTNEGDKKTIAYKTSYPTVGMDEEETPGDIVRSGLLADVELENGASFHTSTNSPATDTTSAYLKAFGATRFFETDFTLEMAFKMPPQPSSSLLPGASDSSFLVYASLWGIRVFRGSTGQLSFYDGNNYNLGRYNDNEWHRLAYVFEKASGLHRIYVDGVQKFAKTRSRSPDTNDDWYLLSEGNKWGSNWGLNVSAGWIDDVRVTEKALRPCEFLTSVPKEDGNTLAWYSFENNSLDNGVYTNAIGAGALSGTAAFAARSPGKVNELWDSAKTKIRDNFTSLDIDGGKAVWPRNSLLEREDLTVEFFARQTAASANAGIISAMRSVSGTNSTAIAAADAIWSIRVGPDGKTPEVYVNNGTEQTVAFPSSAALGAWSHYAVAFVPSGDDTTVKLYYNHALVVTQTITGRLQLPSATGGAIPMLGTTGAGSAAFNGIIDEVRVSLGEVAIVDMLYAPPNAGLMLVFR